jgi:TPR repeat protein
MVALVLAGCSKAPAARGFAVAAPATAIAAPTASAAPTTPKRPLSIAARACAEHAGEADSRQRCLDGDEQACYRAGSQSAGDCRRELFQHACDAEAAPACTELGMELYDPREPADPSRAARAAVLLRRGCELASAKACTLLGELYDNVPAAIPEGALTATVYQRACDLGSAVGCRKAADREHEPDKIKALLQRACGRGDAAGCLRLADMLASEHPATADKIQRVKEILRAACAQNEDNSDSGESCARLLGYSNDLAAPEQSRLIARACGKGHSRSCMMQASEAFSAGRYPDAVAPAARAVELGSLDWNAHHMRAMSLYYLGRFGEAVPALERFCTIRHDVYCELWLWVARGRSGQSDGVAKLRQSSSGFDRTAWPGPVITYFLGEASEAELLRHAKVLINLQPTLDAKRRLLEQECEAFYYIGSKNFVDGDAKSGARRLEQTVGTGITNFVEHIAARLEIDRSKPKKP